MTGDRRVEQHLRLVRLPRAARVRPCQLRRQGRRQVGRRENEILMNSFESIFFLYSMKLVERRNSDPNPIYLL